MRSMMYRYGHIDQLIDYHTDIGLYRVCVTNSGQYSIYGHSGQQAVGYDSTPDNLK